MILIYVNYGAAWRGGEKKRAVEWWATGETTKALADALGESSFCSIAEREACQRWLEQRPDLPAGRYQVGESADRALLLLVGAPPTQPRPLANGSRSSSR